MEVGLLIFICVSLIYVGSSYKIYERKGIKYFMAFQVICLPVLYAVLKLGGA